MNSILILTPFLQKISDGKLFKFVFSILFKLSALISLFTIIFIIWKLFGKYTDKTPTNVFISMILMGLLFSSACFISFNILWVRANDIKNLPVVRDYSVTPIMVIILKTAGELSASVIILCGSAISFATWIAGPQIQKIAPFTVPVLFKASGAVPIITSIVAGFALLFMNYFIAEQLGALVENAKNTRQLVTLGIQKVKSGMRR